MSIFYWFLQVNPGLPFKSIVKSHIFEGWANPSRGHGGNPPRGHGGNPPRGRGGGSFLCAGVMETADFGTPADLNPAHFCAQAS